MRHRKRTSKLGRPTGHRQAMLANLACSLIEEGRIMTTTAKAKEVRRLAEKMVTLGKKGSLHDRRRAISILKQPVVVRRLFNEIAPQYAERNGGYTRILRLGQRQGDGAEMCFIELVEQSVASAPAAAVEADSEE